MSVATINRTTLAVAALTAATFTATATIGATEAEARRLVARIGYVHSHIHYRHLHHRLYIAPIIATSYVGGSCHWLKVKAYNTGSPYWRARYQDCLGF